MSIYSTRLVFPRADQGLATSKRPWAASQTYSTQLGEYIFPWNHHSKTLSLPDIPFLPSLAPRKVWKKGALCCYHLASKWILVISLITKSLKVKRVSCPPGQRLRLLIDLFWQSFCKAALPLGWFDINQGLLCSPAHHEWWIWQLFRFPWNRSLNQESQPGTQKAAFGAGGISTDSHLVLFFTD